MVGIGLPLEEYTIVAMGVAVSQRTDDFYALTPLNEDEHCCAQTSATDSEHRSQDGRKGQEI